MGKEKVNKKSCCKDAQAVRSLNLCQRFERHAVKLSGAWEGYRLARRRMIILDFGEYFYYLYA